MAGGHQVGQGQLLLIFVGQKFQQAEMPHIRQLFDQLLADDGVIGTGLEIPFGDQDTDFQVFPQHQAVSAGILIAHFIRFFQDF